MDQWTNIVFDIYYEKLSQFIPIEVREHFTFNYFYIVTHGK